MKGLVNWLKKIDRRKYAAPIGVMTKITTARDGANHGCKNLGSETINRHPESVQVAIADVVTVL